MALSRALMYAELVGKYVRMQRPRDDEVEMREALAVGMSPDTPVGGEGTVVLVEDRMLVGGPAVIITFDYGMSCGILDNDDWTFMIWENEAAADHLRDFGPNTHPAPYCKVCHHHHYVNRPHLEESRG